MDRPERPDGFEECAICAAYGTDHPWYPADEMREIEYDPTRDGAREHTVYACAECAREIDRDAQK